MFFEPGLVQPDAARSDAWNRGAYIVKGPGHCVECHTPRNLLGGLKRDELLAGNPQGPEGGKVPAIDPATSESFRQWSVVDIVFSLQTGMLPDGDFFGGSMGHVVENSTSRLSEQDLKAIAEYLQSPDVRADSGFLVSVFGRTNAAVEQNHPTENGQSTPLPAVIMWLIWLIPLGGVVWLIVGRSKKQRARSNARTSRRSGDPRD